MSFFSHVNGGGISAVHPAGQRASRPDDRAAPCGPNGRSACNRLRAQSGASQARHRAVPISANIRNRNYAGCGTARRLSTSASRRAKALCCVTRHQQGTHRPSRQLRSSDRTVAVAFHEGYHCAAALHNGVRVLKTTIVADGEADGLTTMLLDRKDCPTIHAYVSMAAEESDIGEWIPDAA